LKGLAASDLRQAFLLRSWGANFSRLAGTCLRRVRGSWFHFFALPSAPLLKFTAKVAMVRAPTANADSST
jgi:hypothetical protein